MLTMTRFIYAFFVALCLVIAVPFSSAFSQTVQDGASAEYFRDRLHSPDIMGYIQATADNTVIQGLHQGQWSLGNQLIFSVGGNSFRDNKFYIDGFRTDSRLNAGSTYYVPNMEVYGLGINVHNSSLYFSTDSATLADGHAEYLRLTGNIGHLGGINRSSVPVVHVFHNTGSEDLYDDVSINNRQHVRAAGSVDVSYLFDGADGKAYRQHLFVAIGDRRLPQYNENGLIPESPLYDARYHIIQIDGQMPAHRVFDSMGYFINVSSRDDGRSEFYYNRVEQPVTNDYSASIYGKRGPLTTGLTWTTQTVRHAVLNFSRNLVDQDGESFEPWMPDGATHELSWALAFHRPCARGFSLDVDAYNSLIAFSPTVKSWHNDLYFRPIESSSTSFLYRYNWSSHGFVGALFDNSVSLSHSSQISDNVFLRLFAGLTLDGMVAGSNSRLTPNVIGGLSLDMHPAGWLRIGADIEHDRVGYNVETLRYMSPDYLNAKVMRRSGQFSQTGGAFHSFKKGTWQTSYLSVYIPVVMTWGRHEVALIQTFKKYYHVWNTTFKGGAEANGSFDADGVFWLNEGLHEYEVGHLSSDLCGSGPILNSPYYVSQQTRYTFRGQKVLVSASWQSLQAAGPRALGNGPVANNIGALSESTANPNTHRTLRNPDGRYPANGRYDQDKGFILRTYFCYNVCRWLQLGLAFNWTDGQPFTFYNTRLHADENGDNAVAVTPIVSRGTNPTDGNFGCRESAIFNYDLHSRFVWNIRGHESSLYLQCYNIWDHGNVLNEFCFSEPYTDGRGPNMCLTIPRGLIFSYKLNL